MTINAAMLVGLGFLVAALLAVLIAPAYRRRTVRLTTDALKRSLPLTEAEMRADKDRLRAEHAIRVHNLEAKLETVTLNATRQTIEVNRRDARISALESTLAAQKTDVDELENARRVLEHTVTDRLPKIEVRLVEARKLLTQRDHELSTLADTAQKQARAIAEATQINVAQAGEIERLTSALQTRAARNQDSLGDARFDGEVALRSEIDALRSKARDQSALIESLQDLLAHAPSGASSASRAAASAAGDDYERIAADLGDMQQALRAANAEATAALAGSNSADAELQRLRAERQDTAAELARLKAALAAYEAGDGDRKAKDSPIAMKARISALEAENREQVTTIATLRAEMAAINERLARQANHYMEEMKRLGAGTLPASGEARRARPEAARRSLSDRINDPRVVQLTPAADRRSGAAVDDADALAPAAPAPLFSLKDQPPLTPAPVPASASVSPALFGRTDAAMAPAAPANDVTGAPQPPAAAAKAQASAPARRPRLLERITSIDKPTSG